MATVYCDIPDDRQMSSTSFPTSRFRPAYRALTPDEKVLHDALKAKAAELEDLYNRIRLTQNKGRYHALAMTSLEESVMWAVKELTT